MKSKTLISQKTSEIFEQLNSFLGGTLTKEPSQYILKINNELGQGTIKGSSFKGGISFIDFDLYLNEDLNLSINCPDTNPLIFSYCTEGQVGHSFEKGKPNNIVSKYQTGILACKEGQGNHLYFAKEMPLRTIVISVQTVGQKNDLNSKLRNSILSKKSPGYFYVGSYNLKIAEIVKQLDSVKQKGIVRNLLIEGYVHMILGLELQQHADDNSKDHQNKGSLNSREMDAIYKLSEFIDNYPEKPMTIKYLCTKSGLSPRKLQEGFKMMHNTTVTDYIRDVRIKRAEQLLKNTDLNVSEVVYSIGITSRSYFSKIFKQKYDCCPKHYKDQHNMVAVNA